MKTLVLPGYSEHNRNWAKEVSRRLDLGHEIASVEWEHWDSKGVSFSLRREFEKILKLAGKDKVNIIAKSVGVYVTLNLIPEIADQVGKIILCGIASVEGKDRKDLVKAVVGKIPVENILCIQNENDKYVTFLEAEKFYHSVNPEIRVISKPRSDHDYPFFEDFREFLKQGIS